MGEAGRRFEAEDEEADQAWCLALWRTGRPALTEDRKLVVPVGVLVVDRGKDGERRQSGHGGESWISDSHAVKGVFGLALCKSIELLRRAVLARD